MMKRATWLAVGFGLGVVTSERARRRVADLAPPALVARARHELQAAVAEGRAVARRREAALRRAFAAPGARHPGQ